jgi:hypothetical protein
MTIADEVDAQLTQTMVEMGARKAKRGERGEQKTGWADVSFVAVSTYQSN